MNDADLERIEGDSQLRETHPISCRCRLCQDFEYQAPRWLQALIAEVRRLQGIDQASVDGVTAFFHSKSRDANPHTDPELRVAWWAGYDGAKDDNDVLRLGYQLKTNANEIAVLRVVAAIASLVVERYCRMPDLDTGYLDQLKEALAHPGVKAVQEKQ